MYPFYASIGRNEFPDAKGIDTRCGSDLDSLVIRT